MIDARLVQHLDAAGIRFCVIGGIALAVHGIARYTADVDLLTMDRRVLEPGFWAGTPVGDVSRADLDAPLAGLVRWPGPPPHDLLVGRGHAMQLAVDTAEPNAALGCRVATALAFLLLKLEAGGPQDRWDVVSLVQAQRALGRHAWLVEIPAHLPRLSPEARACWARLERDLELA